MTNHRRKAKRKTKENYFWLGAFSVIRFNSIESLRAWMAWSVVVDHTLAIGGLNENSAGHYIPSIVHTILLNGGTAVKVFIIVSGFVITHLLLEQRERYVPYILRRAFRIFPIFLVCLVFAIAVLDLYTAAFIQPDWTANAGMRLARMESENTYFYQHLLLHLTMLHGVVPNEVLPFAATTLLGPAWSLSLEWQFYLVAPFLILMLFGRIWLLATGVAFLLVLHWIVGAQTHYSWQWSAFLPEALPYFLIGIGFRGLLHSSKTANITRFLPVIFCAAFFSDAKVLLVWGMFTPFLFSEAGWLKLPLPFQWVATFAFHNRIAINLGKWSYSTYLVHFPLLVTFVGGYSLLFGEEMSQQASWIMLALGFITLIPLSWALYSWIERPFIKYGASIVPVR